MVLDDEVKEKLRRVLALFSEQIEAAALFGSRATERARENSDIDLVLYGDLTQKHVDRLWTLFEESDLPVTVDVIAYSAGLYPPLKHHIDTCAIPLFARDDLLGGRIAMAW